MSTTMRAFQIDQPGTYSELKQVEREIPSPNPGQVRIRVAYCGLNPLDIIVRSGGAAWLAPGWPLTPGVEHSGVIDAVGEGVDPSWIGSAVVSRSAFGGNADFSVTGLENVALLDDDLDLLTGAVYRGCSHTAWRLLHEAVRVRSSDAAVFHSAAGPVAIILTQLAKRLGLMVIGLVGGPAKAAYAAQFGADHLIDTTGKGDWCAQVMTLTGGAGVHLVVDGVGGDQSTRDLEVVAPGGEVVFIGATSGSPAAAVSPGPLIVKHAAVRGFNLPLAERIGPPVQDVDAAIVALVRSGELKIPITSVSPFDSIPDLHRRFEDRQIHGRAVIEVGGAALEQHRIRARSSAA